MPFTLLYNVCVDYVKNDSVICWTQDQYSFCYRAALEYLGSFDHYANWPPHLWPHYLLLDQNWLLHLWPRYHPFDSEGHGRRILSCKDAISCLYCMIAGYIIGGYCVVLWHVGTQWYCTFLVLFCAVSHWHFQSNQSIRSLHIAGCLANWAVWGLHACG